jgi:tagatose 6-phosphate kinase
MILCVNANAAIDKTLVVSPFRLNTIHRPQQVLALPGGKGANVARGLQHLGETPVVTGWVGGHSGQYIATRLHGEGIETIFVHLESESRTCLSILDPEQGTLTEIYEHGEPVPEVQVEAFKDVFRSVVAEYAVVTLSGSLPRTCDWCTIADQAERPRVLSAGRARARGRGRHCDCSGGGRPAVSNHCGGFVRCRRRAGNDRE